MKPTIFKDWKARASQVGHLLTSLTTKEDLDNYKKRKSELLYEKENLQNANGRKVSWTDNKQKELDKLESYISNPNPLPKGAITHLDDIFRSEFWGRRRILYNKYLEKGIMQENDALELLGHVDRTEYFKNEEELVNDWVRGVPDNRQDDKIRDTKANYDFDSFDRAESDSLYEWQIKTYCWLDGKTEGELCYCLVNTPRHRLEAEVKSTWYAMGMPSEDNEEWIETQKQIERNMIFDPIRYQEDYPDYKFLNPREELIVPAIFRVKKFKVKLEDGDIEAMKQRIELGREYLINKELEAMRLIQEYANGLDVHFNESDY